MKAHWEDEEHVAFLKYLVEHKAEAGDNGMFKDTAMEHAAAAIAHLQVRGAVKDTKICQNKYGAFRRIHRVIEAIRNVSRWTWNNKTGASITPATTSSWDDYVTKHTQAKPFRNARWEYLEYLDELVTSPATGTNVFHPTVVPPSIQRSLPDTTSAILKGNTEPDGSDESDNEENDNEAVRTCSRHGISFF
ncbi:hypothetical protein FA15DRAFT_605615 [Coprinopsis marcescibilis]|uniref:Myb/SANT-like domain-containing protein n=1 Tax=Coprinopsis marcescibilis TaxID=230819 RepID=A0A5C3KBE7_COPMA|nr:hypothetical protein FA15DRAFT_605615 [Coprinopsis marcescibilis]